MHNKKNVNSEKQKVSFFWKAKTAVKLASITAIVICHDLIQSRREEEISVYC